jgi:hypothetical protein
MYKSTIDFRVLCSNRLHKQGSMPDRKRASRIQIEDCYVSLTVGSPERNVARYSEEPRSMDIRIALEDL